MGLKADASFLRFVTMGAVGALSAIEHLRELGFEPMELERYCTSNKIWQTKVKRLRLPDLLCRRTGVRFEVRGKSALAVKMSHAEHNPDRAWDAGLRDDDVAAFIWVGEPADGRFAAPHPPVCFTVRDMRATSHLARLGPPKSASEGAERDLEWPTTVPKKAGRVTRLQPGKLSIFKHGEARPNYTYRLNGKTPYVGVNDVFPAEATILAGVLPNLADLAGLAQRSWRPHDQVRSQDALSRYAAVKALPHLDATSGVRDLLISIARNDLEPRVAIEAAGSAALAGHDDGFALLERTALAPSDAAVEALGGAAAQMEAVLVLTEVAAFLGDHRASDALLAVATDEAVQESEVAQAAVWGLGRAGGRDYQRLIDFIGNQDRDVALHAVCGFGPDLGQGVIHALVGLLGDGNPRVRSSASEILARSQPPGAVGPLAALARAGGDGSAWAIATLGRLDPSLVAGVGDLQAAIRPVQLMSHGSWLGEPGVTEDLAFLAAQVVGI